LQESKPIIFGLLGSSCLLVGLKRCGAYEQGFSTIKDLCVSRLGLLAETIEREYFLFEGIHGTLETLGQHDIDRPVTPRGCVGSGFSKQEVTVRSLRPTPTFLRPMDRAMASPFGPVTPPGCAGFGFV